jgi:hypothetical protein
MLGRTKASLTYAGRRRRPLGHLEGGGRLRREEIEEQGPVRLLLAIVADFSLLTFALDRAWPMACNAPSVGYLVAREGDAMAETPGWRDDPFGQHQERFFNRSGEPTRLVRNDGVQTLSPQAEMPSSIGAADTPPTPPDAARDGPSTNDSDSAVLSTASNEPQKLGVHDTKPTVHPPLVGSALPVTDAHTSPKARRKRSRLELVILSLGALLLVCAAVVAFQQHSAANKWMHDDQQAVHHNVELTTALNQIHAQIKDRNAVLAKVVLDAAAIAGDLKPCILDVNTLANDLSGNVEPPPSLADGTAVQLVCAQAQEESQHLQNDLSGG